MSEAGWFSTCVSVACLIEDRGTDAIMTSVFVFMAQDWESAFARALELGRKQERSYRNDEGKTVTWRLWEVVTLDRVADEHLDGVEVYSDQRPPTAAERFPFDADFDPASSRPSQTV